MFQKISFLIFLLFMTVAANGAVKNVLFVMFDDLRPVLGAYDGPAITENMDSVAKSGVQFQNAYAQLALCGPSRNSMLTSRRPDTVRLYDFTSYWRSAAGNFTTLPQYLKQSGYDTYSIGKIFHPGIPSNFSDDYPYSWSEPAWHPPTDEFKNSPTCHTNGTWKKNIVCPVNLTEQPSNTLPDIESTNHAVNFLKSRKSEKPFFLGLGYHKPHIPLKFPEEFLGGCIDIMDKADLYPLDKVEIPEMRTKPEKMPEVAWNPFNDLRARDDIAALNVSYPYGPFTDEWIRRLRQSYYASVSYVDKLFGEVLQSLRENGFENNTIIVVMGDHGWSLGEHGEWAKYSLFENSVRTPLIIKCPNLTSGKKIKQAVELVDIFPTMVDLLGLKKIPTCSQNKFEELCTEGRSLMPMIWSGTEGESVPVFSQYPRPGVTSTVIPDTDNPDLKDITVMGYSVRTERYRYNLWVSWKNFTPNWSDIKGTELYDHSVDPNENFNLAGNPDIADAEKNLKKILHEKFRPRETRNKVLATLDLDEPLHVVNEKFLSFALDTSFVARTLPNMTEEKWQKLAELSGSLAPAILRLGGTDADRLFFSEEEKNDFVNLSPDNWAKFNVFLDRANLTLLFDFNVLLRNNEVWDSSNAQKILESTKTDGFKVSHFQLGNEPNSFQHVFNVTISPEQLGQDFRTLGKVLDLDRFYNKSRLIGPDVTNPRLEETFKVTEETTSTKVLSQSQATTVVSLANAPTTDATTKLSPTTKTTLKSSNIVKNASTGATASVLSKRVITSLQNVTLLSKRIKKLLATSDKNATTLIASTTESNTTPSGTGRTRTLASSTHSNATDDSTPTTPSLSYLKRFLNSSIDILDAVSWHHYYLNGRTATVDDFLSVKTLDSLKVQISAVEKIVREFSDEVPIWLTETGSAYGGGAPNISDRYASIFLLLDKLGISAKFGIDLVIRQSLYGGHYALLTPKFEPNPDFWVSLLYKKLVGSEVYNVSTGYKNVRLYAHSALPTPCLRNSSLQNSYVVYGLNLDKEAKQIELKGADKLTFCAKYIFTAPEGDLTSPNVLLNNKLLTWGDVKSKVNDFVNDYGSIELLDLIPPHSSFFLAFALQ